MLSIFNRRKDTFKVFPTAEPIGFTKTSDNQYGVNVTVPVTVFSGSSKVQSRVVFHMADIDIAQIAGMIGIPVRVEVNKDDVAANRPKFCKNSHRQISENVIHWPNGNEDCRICYLKWERKSKAKAVTK